MINKSGWRHVIGWLCLIGLAVLPCLIDPLRIEAYESPRAMLSIVLSLGIGLSALAGFYKFPSLTRLVRQPLILAIMLWVISIVISAILSLSPSRSILGDLQRRMGALTQLSLLMAFVGGMLLTRRQRGQSVMLLAFVGLIVAGYGFLQGTERPSSTFGVATFAASWCVIVILWLGTAVLAGNARAGPGPGPTKTRYLLLFSLVVLLVFLIFTQTRGAALGLLAGLLVIVFLWGVLHRAHWLELTLLAGTVLFLIVGMGLYSGVFTLDRRIPLIGRLDMINDQSGKFRLLLWQSAGQTASEWPVMVSVDGTADRLSGLRPFVGYGQEMLADVMRPRLNADLQATFPDYQFVDRAHNLWLDTLLTQGWLGLLSLIAVYLAAAWMCLKMLLRQGQTWGTRGWMAAGILAILVAHIVDLQFSFPSVSSEWPLWAILGILYAEARVETHGAVQSRSRSLVWIAPVGQQHLLLLPLLSGLLAWPIQINLTQRLPSSTLIAIVLLTLITFIATQNRRLTLLSALMAALAILIENSIYGSIRISLDNSQVVTSFTLMLAYHIMMMVAIGLTLGIALWRVHRRIKLPRHVTFALALIMLIASLWWTLDATADSVFLVASQQPDQVRATFYRSALQLKLPDDRLIRLTEKTVRLALPVVPVDSQNTWATYARNLADQAKALNPYAAEFGES